MIMTAFKLAGYWAIKLVPHIVRIEKGGLAFDHDMRQDRVIITQGDIARQVAWWNHDCMAILPLSGMIHPDDIVEMQTRILGQLGVEPSNWPAPPEILDPGRNNKEYQTEHEGYADEDE